jgi:hypothetical protein
MQSLVISVTGLPKAQVLTTNQTISRNLVQLIAKSTPGTPQYDPKVANAMPLAVIGIGDFKPRQDRGIQNDAYDADLTIWYIAQETDSFTANMTMQAQVNALAYQLGVAVRLNMPNTTGAYNSFLQMDSDGRIDSSEMEPLNYQLRAMEKISVISASITWTASLMVGDFALPGNT